MGPCAVLQLFKLVNRNKCVTVETDLDKVLRCALLPLSLCPIVLCPRRWWRIVIVKRLQQQFVESWVKGRRRRRQRGTPTLSSLIVRVERVEGVLGRRAEREQEHVGAELDGLRQTLTERHHSAWLRCTVDKVNTSCNQWGSHAHRCGHLPAPRSPD